MHQYKQKQTKLPVNGNVPIAMDDCSRWSVGGDVDFGVTVLVKNPNKYTTLTNVADYRVLNQSLLVRIPIRVRTEASGDQNQGLKCLCFAITVVSN